MPDGTTYVVTFYNIISDIGIESDINYREFCLSSIGTSLTINAGDKTYKSLNTISVTVNTHLCSTVYHKADSELNKFLYKLSVLCSGSIFRPYPRVISTNKIGEDPVYYSAKAESPTLNPMKKSFVISDLFNYELYKECAVPITFLHTNLLRLLSRITLTYIHLAYLHFSASDKSIDINLRLLSAWKYFEEYVNLKGYSPLNNKIPECLFRDILQTKTIRYVTSIKISKGKTYWISVNEFSQSFLDDFYNEVRLPLAHHQRSSNTYRTSKKHTPNINARKDCLMGYHMKDVLTLIRYLNSNLFNFPKLEVTREMNIDRKDIVKLKFRKRLPARYI